MLSQRGRKILLSKRGNVNLGRGKEWSKLKDHTCFWILPKLVPNHLHIHTLCQTLLAESKTQISGTQN